MSIEDERERQAMIQRDGGEGLARAILYRRKRKCIAQDSHNDGGCARCGQ